MTMLSIGQITDLHLVESGYRQRGTSARLRLQFLNTGRRIEPDERRRNALAAFRRARGCDHVVLTGDLTEDGTPEQFELLGSLLEQSGLDPARVSVIPGNHDLYSDACGFERALDGPLRRFARTSRAGRLLDLGTAFLLPVDTAAPRHVTRSSGVFRPEFERQIAALASDAACRLKPLLVAQHHPPTGHRSLIWNFIDGIERGAHFAHLLERHPQLHVLHGHTHGDGSHALVEGRRAQIHAAAAILDGADNMRLYHVRDNTVVAVSIGRARSRRIGEGPTHSQPLAV